jgi:hypothetical protein
MPTLDLALDLDAAILPGVGAAGLRVGMRLAELPSGLLEGFSVERRVNPCLPNAVLTLYRSAAVTLTVENRVIDQIAVHGAYVGTVPGSRGTLVLGESHANVEACFGPLAIDDEGYQIIAELPGLRLVLQEGHVTRIAVFRL